MIGDKNAIFVVHTVAVSQTEIMGHFHDLAPSVIIRNIVDDSLLTEVIRNDGVTTHVRQRMIDYFIGAQNAGADVILNQCSSVGEVAEFAQELVDIPIVRIDRRMARNACGMGNRIGVVATLPTTMGPTCRLIQRSADALGKSIEITEGLAAGAFDALIAGDRAVHNRLVIDVIKRIAKKVDVVVCAQGSMTALLGDVAKENVSTPILTSLRSGVEETVDVLKEMQPALSVG